MSATLRLVSSDLRLTSSGEVRVSGGDAPRVSGPVAHDVKIGGLERLDTRLDAIAASLTAALPDRIVSRTLKHLSAQAASDLDRGIVMLVSAGEGDFVGPAGQPAFEGVQHIMLVVHLKVAEGSPASDVEAAELSLIEEIKAWMRTGIEGLWLAPTRIEHSRQLEAPYGWAVIFADAGLN